MITNLDNLMLKELQNCPRKYYYRHELGLTVEREAPNYPASFGIGIHDGLEVYFKQLREGSVDEDEVVKTFLSSFTEEQPAPTLKSGRQGEALYTRVRGSFLLLEYINHWENDFDVVEVEIGAAEELEEDIFYCGRIDLVIEDFSGIRSVDHKTTSRMDRITANPNRQFMGYQWLTERYFGEDNVSGIVADIIGVYKSKPVDEVFDRQYEKYNDLQMERWVQETLYLVEQLKSYRDRATWPMNTDHCGAYAGRCIFLPLCVSSTLGSEQRLIENMYKVDRWVPYGGKE